MKTILISLAFIIFSFNSLVCGKINTEMVNHSKIEFVENRGQVADMNYKPMPEILFTAQIGGKILYVRKNGLSFVFSKTNKPVKNQSPDSHNYEPDTSGTITYYRTDLNFVGCNPDVIATGDLLLPQYNNYYLTQCPDGITFVPIFEKVIYHELYPNIDLVLYTNKDGEFQYDFIIRPGGDPGKIKMKYISIDNLNIKDNGSLSAHNLLGEIEQHKPYSYQTENDTKSEIASSFKVTNDETIEFQVDSYDKTNTLIIDPLTRVWGTYYGGNNTDEFLHCFLTSNAVYICGETHSDNGISTTGSHQYTFGGGGWDGYIAKFNLDGERQWATYYGGSSLDWCLTIKVGNSGNIYVWGETWSSNAISTAGAHQTSHGGGSRDVFIVKLTSSGVRQWGTYYGGSGEEWCNWYNMDIDVNENIYFTIRTTSTSNIATSGSYQASLAGDWDACLVKFNSDGVRQWGTYFGGTGDDWGEAVSCYGNDIYLAGATSSTSGIATTGSYQTSLGGGYDSFLAKFSSDGALEWSTYYGGPSNEFYSEPYSNLGCDSQGNPYFFSLTLSSSSIASSGAHQTSYAGGVDTYLVKFNSSGQRQWATYYGGSGTEYSGGISFDDQDNVYISGGTSSTNQIATNDGYQTTFGNKYVAKFNSSGTRIWGSYFACSNAIEWPVCQTQIYGSYLYLFSSTDCTSGITTSGSYQPNYAGGDKDVFIIKFIDSEQPTITTSAISPSTYCSGSDIPVNFTISGTYNSSNVFTAQLSDSTGSFASPVSIGTLNGASDGTINATIPDTILTGKKYRIRVISSDPKVTGSDNGSNITIYGKPSAINGSDTVCANSQQYYISGLPTGATAKWYCTGGTINGSSTEPYVTIDWGTGTAGNVKIVQTIQSADCKDSTEKNITINPLPHVNILGSTSVCINNRNTYYAEDSAGYNSKWYLNDTWVFGSDNKGFVNILWDKIKTNKISLIQTSKSTGCIDSSIIEITVNSPPIVEIVRDAEHKYTGYSSIDTICVNGQATFTAGTIPGRQHQWINKGGKALSPATGPSFTMEWAAWDTTGQYWVRLIQTDSVTGCIDSATVWNYVFPIPKPAITGIFSVCSKNQYTYTSNPEKNILSHWIVTGGTIQGSSNNKDITIQWGDTTTGEIKLIEINKLSGCADSTAKLITINPLPQPKIKGIDKVCTNFTETYSTTTDNKLNYNWEATNGTITDGTNNSIIHVKWGAPGKGKLKLTETNKNTGCKDSTTLDITITDKPVVTITGNFSVCEKSEEIYTTSSSSELSSHWEVTGGTINGSADSANLTVDWGNAGLGNIKLVQTMVSTSVKDSTEQRIIINSLPSQPTISRRGDTLISSYDTGNQWLYKGVKIEGAVNKEYLPADEGKYTVQVTDSNNCASVSSQPSDFLFVNWHPVNNGLKELKIWFIGYFESRLFVCTTNGGIYASDDFGLNWSLSNTGIQYMIGKESGIQGADEIKSMTSINHNLLSGSSYGSVYISDDKGKNWTVSSNGVTKTDIWSFVPLNGTVLCGTSSGGIFASTNSGAKWLERSSGIPNSDVRSLAVIGNNLFAGMWDGGVFTSSNGGDNWIAVNNGLTNPKISSLNAMDNDLLAGTWGSGVFASYDMGANWKTVNQGLLNQEIYTLVSKDNNILAGTNGNGVYLSMDRGTNWNDKSEGLVEKEIRTIAIAGDYVFAGTWGGGVYRIRLSDLIVGVREYKEAEPCCLRIVPNPTDKMINIFYKLPEQGGISIRILNSLGMLIYNEIRINSDASQEQVLSIPVGELSNGIYFCQITGRQSSLSEKFIIIK